MKSSFLGARPVILMSIPLNIQSQIRNREGYLPKWPMATQSLLEIPSSVSKLMGLTSKRLCALQAKSLNFRKCSNALLIVALAALLSLAFCLCRSWYQRRVARLADLRRRCIQKKHKEARNRIRREMMEMYWGTLKKIEDLKNTPSCLMTDWQKQVSQTRSIEHGKKMIKVMQEDLKVQLEFIERWYGWQHSKKELRQVLAGNSDLLQAVWN